MPSLPPFRAHLRPAAIVRAALLGIVVGRFVRGTAAQAAMAAPDPPATAPRCAVVVVPARDEERRIGPCVSSLVAQEAEVVVVDDGSTDRTREVAEAAGATVVDAGTLPDGWAGKAHALHVGLGAVDAPVVVFVDADTRARPGFVAAAVDVLGDATLVTAGAQLVGAGPGERWLHPSMLTSLVYRLGRPGVVPGRAHRTLANGQCMVVDRARLVDAGGFEAVRDALLEDLALARSLAARGHEVRFLDATSVLAVEAYGSLREAWRGWGRSLDLAPVTPLGWQALDLAVVWSTMALPIPRVLAGRGDALDAAALLVRAGTLAGTRGAYDRRGLAYLLSPLADAAVAARITVGTLRPSRSWRGRSY